jgi:hypothetical protein
MENNDKIFDAFKRNLENKINENIESNYNLDNNYSPLSKITKLSNFSFLSKFLISLGVTVLLVTSAFLFIPVFDKILLEKYIKIVNFATGNYAANDDLDYLNFKDIVYLELSDSELKNIGIIKSNDTVFLETESLYYPDSIRANIRFRDDEKLDSLERQTQLLNYSHNENLRYSKKGYDTNDVILLKRKYEISHYLFNSYLLQYNGWANNVYNKYAPVAIHTDGSCYLGSSTKCISTNTESPIISDFKESVDTIARNFSYFSKPRSIKTLALLSKMIPVKITMYNHNPSKPKKTRFPIIKTEVVLWFIPTEEFLNALPERYGLRIRNELQIIEKIENGEITTKQACKELGNEKSVFGICMNFHDNLEITSIYPSPGREDTRVKFINNKEQLLTAKIYNYNATEINTIVEKKQFSTGEHILWIDLSKFAPGFYIVVIIDEEGNTISSKFMKE